MPILSHTTARANGDLPGSAFLPPGVTQHDIDGPLVAEPLQADPFDERVSRALSNALSEDADDIAANFCDALARPDASAAWADLYRVVGQMRVVLSRELVKLGYAPLPGLPKIGGGK